MSNDGYPDDWDRRRAKVYKSDGYQCQNCDRYGGPKGPNELHAHHIVPKSRGGTHKYSNLVTLCEGCHDAVHNKNVMAPTADGGGGLQPDPVDAAKEAAKTYRTVKRAMRLFS